MATIIVDVPEFDATINAYNGRRDWEDWEVAYLESYYGKPGIRVRDLMKKLGRSYRAITNKALTLGLTNTC